MGGPHAVAWEVRPTSGALLCVLTAIAVLLAPAAATADTLRGPLIAPLTALTAGPPVNVSVPTVAGQAVQGVTLIL